jgi:hypothetical protein
MVNNVLLANDGFILRKSVINQSGATSVDLDNIFDTTRDVYQIDINNVVGSATASLNMQFLDSSGTLLTASNYNYSIQSTEVANARTNNNGNMTTSIQLLETTTDEQVNCQLLIFNPASTTFKTKGLMLGGNTKGSTGTGFASGGFEYNATDALRGIRLSLSSGTFSDCDIMCHVLATESAG